MALLGQVGGLPWEGTVTVSVEPLPELRPLTVRFPYCVELKLTVLPVPVKPVPVMVTLVPTGPDTGEI